MSLGNTLRAAREACGITTSELAARTHMLVQIVEGLENEDFRRIPAPIYGRGFIKLYCEAVNIDPKPLQAEFMELFNRPKNDAANAIAEPPPRRPPPPMPEPEPPQQNTIPPKPVEQPQTAPEPSQPAISDLGELFSQPAKFAPIRRPAEPAAPALQQQPPKRSYGDIFGQTYAAEEETPKQSAAEKFRNTMSNVSSGVFSNVQKLPHNTGRIIAVSLCAVLTFAIIGWGIFALYKATSPIDVVSAEKSETVAGKTPETKSVAKSAERKSAKEIEKKTSVETAKTGTEKPSSQPPDSVRPGDLTFSGIEIPALYID